MSGVGDAFRLETENPKAPTTPFFQTVYKCYTHSTLNEYQYIVKGRIG